MPSRSTVSVAGIALAAIACLASCGDAGTPPTAAPLTPTSTSAAAAPSERAIPTEAGGIVPADQIDAARESGVFVYVDPEGDGTGVVVRAGEPLPQTFVHGLTRAMKPYAAPDGLEPSEETIANAEYVAAAKPYRTAVQETGEIPYGMVYRGMCLGDPVSPDDPNWEHFYESEEQLEEARWSYHLCTTEYWISAVHGVEGAQEFNRSGRGFDNLDAAVASLQPMVDAHPGLQVVVAD